MCVLFGVRLVFSPIQQYRSYSRLWCHISKYKYLGTVCCEKVRSHNVLEADSLLRWTNSNEASSGKK